MEWFILKICKEHTLRRSKKVGRWPITFMMRSLFWIFPNSHFCICSNLRVALNWRFVISSVYPVRRLHHSCQNFGFWALWKPENASSKSFCSPRSSLESWTLHCFRENFLKYPPNITIGTSFVVYLIPQHLKTWFKMYKLYWFWSSFWCLFCYC